MLSCGNLHGKIALVQLQNVSSPLWGDCGARRLKLADENFSWLTAMFDAQDRLIEIYVDMTDGNHMEEDNPWFVDLYLDYALAENEALELDRDELEAAFAQGNLSSQQYERILAEGEKGFARLTARLFSAKCRR